MVYMFLFGSINGKLRLCFLFKLCVLFLLYFLRILICFLYMVIFLLRVVSWFLVRINLWFSLWVVVIMEVNFFVNVGLSLFCFLCVVFNFFCWVEVVLCWFFKLDCKLMIFGWLESIELISFFSCVCCVCR